MTPPASLPAGWTPRWRIADARVPGVFRRYVGASAAALGVDLGGFLLLLHAALPAAAASAIGYATGITVHWWLSSRIVFVDGLADAGAGRAGQQALFLVSAMIGCGITVGVVGLGAAVGLDPRVAKLGAIAGSFGTMWLLRRHIVFGR